MRSELGAFNAQQREEQRRKAVRALLRRPLLTPELEEFRLIRIHQGWLADWFARETGWTLYADASVARLRKVPLRHADGTRPAQAKGKSAFTRRRYVLTCLALAVLERADSQITLGRLAERTLAFAADPELTTCGIVFTLGNREERGDLAAVAWLLLELGVLRKVVGDEGAYIGGSGDVLYDVDRRVLAVLLAVRRGPSTVDAHDPGTRLKAITEELLPETDEGRDQLIQHALARRLLDDPVLYYRELTETERLYLDRHREPLLQRLLDATGFVAEVRAEGIALLDPTREATDLGMPDEGTDGHATLLLAEYLARQMRIYPDTPVEVAEARTEMERLAARHRGPWRRRKASVPELTSGATDRLAALGLIQVRGDVLIPLPALARFAFGEAVIMERKGA
ncbi:TIGR02678 family protein [Nonomuraea sp. NPDC050202]|uniref:TIGR02678 family protein n=1 Tax=Nonomuraea sp. NPDC050202 TaxID=3155035 RepID=UPI0033E376CC